MSIGRVMDMKQIYKAVQVSASKETQIHQFPLNKHCGARSRIWPPPYDPDFYLSMSDLLGI